MEDELKILCNSLLELSCERGESAQKDERWTRTEKMLMTKARRGGRKTADCLLRFLRKVDLPDAVVDVLAKALASCCGPCAAPPSLRTFTFSPSISIQVNEIDYVQGGLGWKVWKSALILSKRLLSLADDIHGKEVLEVGSGCGLCGLLLPSLGATKVVLTDNVSNILSNLSRNVSLLSLNANSKLDIVSDSNIKGFDFIYRKVVSDDPYLCSLKVRMLDWLEDSEDSRMGMDDSMINTQVNSALLRLDRNEKFDWIVGSDILYDLKSSLALANVIHKRLKEVRAKALLIAPIREKYVLCEFLKELGRLSLLAKAEQVDRKEWINQSVSCLQEADDLDEGGTMYDMDHYEGGIVAIHISR